jgi:hypothetical protein
LVYYQLKGMKCLLSLSVWLTITMTWLSTLRFWTENRSIEQNGNSHNFVAAHALLCYFNIRFQTQSLFLISAYLLSYASHIDLNTQPKQSDHSWCLIFMLKTSFTFHDCQLKVHNCSHLVPISILTLLVNMKSLGIILFWWTS